MNATSTELVLDEADESIRVVLRSAQKPEGIEGADKWVILGSGFKSAEDSATAAARWRSWLMLAFARSGIGVDFGDRAAKGAFTEAGLTWVEDTTGRRAVNDVHGTVVYECDPPPRFASMSVKPVLGRDSNRFMEGVALARSKEATLSLEEQLAYELYSASFFATYADARFLLLMMALETLIDPQPKSEKAQKLIDDFTVMLERSALAEPETASLRGSLGWLRNESISQAGRRLALTLGDNRYMDASAESFFVKSYDLRSRLAHGHSPRPGRTEVEHHSATLERLVGDLISLAI